MDSWQIIRQAGMSRVAEESGYSRQLLSMLTRGRTGLRFPAAEAIGLALVRLEVLRERDRDSFVLDLCRRAAELEREPVLAEQKGPAAPEPASVEAAS